MRVSSLKYQRWLIVLLYLIVVLVGAFNLSSRYEFGFQVQQLDEKLFVIDVKPGSAKSSRIEIADRLLSADGQSIINKDQANWILNGSGKGPPVTFRFERSGIVYDILISADCPHNPLLIILNTLLGIIFLAVGLVVWWSGNHDPTVRSFFLLTSLAGISFLLFSHENIYQSLLLHQIYVFTWLFTYCLIPVALIDFLKRFPRYETLSSGNIIIVRFLYLLQIAVFLVLSINYHKAYVTHDPLLIARYEELFHVGFSSLLSIYLTAAVILLIYQYLKSVNKAMQHQVMWLFICTFIGIIPFAFLYKLPEVFGLKSIIPRWAALSLMLIVPIGWGMAVTSFRMLKLEWALSRTIIYAITVVLVVIILSGAALIGVRYFEQQDNYSLWFLIVFTAIVLFLSVSGLIRHVQTIIDRIYYHDWFNYRKALRRLGEDLSEAVNEELIIQILTERLPDILKLHKATLIIKGEEDMWLVPSQMIPIADDKIGLVIDENISKLSQLGYEIILPLTHSGKMIGVLLLGRKLSEAPFSVRDHQLLNTLSNHAGTALANLALTSKLIDNEKRAIAVDMAGGIAHEINNALAPLMGHAQLIEMSMLGNIDSSMRETLKQPLSIIVDMCNRIQRITSNLSKISEPLHLEESLISLNTIAEETLQLMTETAGRIKRYQTDSTEAKYRLRKDFLRNLPLVKGDSQQLSQVFINLIINASDAIEENKQGILTVGTRLSTDRSFVIGFVADTGSGISKQVLDKIFQPYFTTKPKGKGTGLGMSIVRSIVEAHGGHLTVHSTEGRGTRVEFYLPVPD